MNSKSILCIDDHEDTCQMMTDVLGLEGYKVKTALTLAEGISLAQNERFDLYLVDDGLPDGRGIEFVLKVRAFDAVTPIFYTSADTRESIRQEALAAGAGAFFSKPIELDALQETMARFIDNTSTKSGSDSIPTSRLSLNSQIY